MRHFSGSSLTFLRGLARNNEKPWFEAHRDVYEEQIKQPMADLVEEMDLRLGAFAPEFVGDPKRSVFRINRDIRFSRDKSPYKTHAACWFFHGDGSSKVGREAHGGGAGFYFHLEPGKSLVGGGCWMPPRPALQKFRRGIAADLRGFERVAESPAMRRRFGEMTDDDMLKRTPSGFPPDHPGARWLRFQSFTVGRSLSDAQVTGPRLTTLLASDFKTMLPLVRWLNARLGLEARKSR